jgi:hypothetical protein
MVFSFAWRTREQENKWTPMVFSFAQGTSGHPWFSHLHAINIRGLGFRVEFLVKIGGGGSF